MAETTNGVFWYSSGAINDTTDFVYTSTETLEFNIAKTITSIVDDLSVFADGEVITIAGTPSNDGVYTITGTPTATTITVVEALVTEQAPIGTSLTTPRATVLSVNLPRNITNVSMVIEPDVAGTGNVVVTGKVAGSPEVVTTVGTITIAASPKHDLLEAGSFSELIFTPDTFVTTATFTVHIQATR